MASSHPKHWVWQAFIALGAQGQLTAKQAIAKLQADYPAQPVLEIVTALGIEAHMPTLPPPAHAIIDNSSDVPKTRKAQALKWARGRAQERQAKF